MPVKSTTQGMPVRCPFCANTVEISYYYSDHKSVMLSCDCIVPVARINAEQLSDIIRRILASKKDEGNT